MADNRLTRYPCPCCGFLTLEERGCWDICDVCFWEDDPLQADDPKFWGGANKMSLYEAQVAYKEIGAKEERVKQYVRSPTPDEIPDTPMWLWSQLHAHFDTNDGSLPELWLTVDTPAAVSVIVRHLLTVGHLSPHVEWSWFDLENQEHPLTDVAEVAARIASHTAEPLHVLLTNIVLGTVPLPDLGMLILPDRVELDYRMGEAWNPLNLVALFTFLAQIAEAVPSMTLTVEDSMLPARQEHFVLTWQLFRQRLKNLPQGAAQ
ncbi:MAG: hypothetical protein H0T53_18060 [Herpetosiphonaceae bacterium]|nr:hypothetical protein [Herpetosiphonaceae bacterium]